MMVDSLPAIQRCHCVLYGTGHLVKLMSGDKCWALWISALAPPCSKFLTFRSHCTYLSLVVTLPAHCANRTTCPVDFLNSWENQKSRLLTKIEGDCQKQWMQCQKCFYHSLLGGGSGFFFVVWAWSDHLQQWCTCWDSLQHWLAR